MDGSYANFSAMRLFGCNLGQSKESIDGQFSFKGYNYPLFFTPDAPHMLKLARNALGELKELIDADGKKIEWRFIESLHEIQMDEGFKIGGNKLSKKHVMFTKNKMKVNLAAQTLSSSVADAIQFLEHEGHPKFQGAEGTILFIRKIDRIFDLLNCRSPRGKGFKAPMSKKNMALTDHIINSTVNYLVGLKDGNGKPLLEHRRKTFVLGLITTATSVQKLTKMLFEMNETPFSYFLTYKIGQDHLELLFNCIRGKLGFNTNPDAREFQFALKKILLHAALSPSRHGNCLFLEENRSSPIFSLKWTKNRSPLSKKVDEIDNEFIAISVDFQNSDVKEYSLGYVAGYIVREMMSSLTCETCASALLSKEHHHQYLSLVALKDRGGLIYAAKDVVRILSFAERIFRQIVSGTSAEDEKITGQKNLHLKLLTKTVYEATVAGVFKDQFHHDLQYATNLDEDFHSTQITKRIASRYLTMRLARYGQHYTMQKKEVGKRQHASRMLIFNGY